MGRWRPVWLFLFFVGAGLAAYGFYSSTLHFCPLPAGVPPCDSGNTLSTLEITVGLVLGLAGFVLTIASSFPSEKDASSQQG